mgnify:FL=1
MHTDIVSKIEGYLRFIKPDMRREWNNRNKMIFGDEYRPVQKNRVNLFWTGTYKGEITKHENLGDYLSLVVVEYMLKRRGLALNVQIDRTEYLYAIGSIIGFGLQDATIWGSGLLRKENAFRLVRSKLDIRAVRGPLTKEYLNKMGFNCPEIYGDPAVLMPIIYSCNAKKRYSCSIVLHHSSGLREHIDELKDMGLHYIEIKTTNYKHFIDEIAQSDMVISSALHGIILAEAYGVPTVYLKDTEINQDFKFDDYYSGTGRVQYEYAQTIDEAIKIKPVNNLPKLENMCSALMETFPYDLWSGWGTYVLEYLIIVQYDLLLLYFMDRFVTTYIYNISSIVR